MGALPIKELTFRADLILILFFTKFHKGDTDPINKNCRRDVPIRGPNRCPKAAPRRTCPRVDGPERKKFLRNLVLEQQAAQQVVLQQQAAQQVLQPQQPVTAGDPGMVGELMKLVGSMVTTQLLSNITVFKRAPKDYKRWIRDMERHVQATNGDNSAHIAIATQSAGGVVGDYIFHTEMITRPLPGTRQRTSLRPVSAI